MKLLKPESKIWNIDQLFNVLLCAHTNKNEAESNSVHSTDLTFRFYEHIAKTPTRQYINSLIYILKIRLLKCQFNSPFFFNEELDGSLPKHQLHYVYWNTEIKCSHLLLGNHRFKYIFELTSLYGLKLCTQVVVKKI